MQTRSRGAVVLQLSWSQGRSHSQWTCTGSTHKGVNQCLKYVIQVQQQRPELPTVTLTWHAYMGPTWAVSLSCVWLQLLRVKIHHKVSQYMPVCMSWEVSLVHPLSSSHPWQGCTGLCVLMFAFVLDFVCLCLHFSLQDLWSDWGSVGVALHSMLCSRIFISVYKAYCWNVVL